MFTGREYDSETDLYSCRARMFSPALGRFLQPDPIGYADSMNLYQYCGNNPINRIDPHGQMWGWVEKVWDWFWGNAPQEVAEEVVDQAVDKLYVSDGDASFAGEGMQAGAKMGQSIPQGKVGLDAVWDNAKKNLAEGAKECATEGVEKAAKETAQKGIKNCVKETFPDTKELAKRLGISPKDIHRVKDDILSQTRKYTKKIGADNPDIGVDDLGNIVLKNRKTGQTINTGIPLESFAD